MLTWVPAVFAIGAFAFGEPLSLLFSVIGSVVGLVPLTVCLSISLVVGCFVVATTDSIFLDGLIHGTLIVCILFVVHPTQIFRPVVTWNAIDMVHKRLTLWRKAVERTANDLMHLAVLAMESDLAIAVPIVGSKCPPKRFEPAIL